MIIAKIIKNILKDQKLVFCFIFDRNTNVEYLLMTF